jgi:uncharacterized protein YjbJ (UPF0337 family)
MNEDRLAGNVKNLGGEAETEIGRAAGDVRTQIAGKVRQVEGTMQDLYGQGKDAAADAVQSLRETASHADDLLRNTIEQRPYTTAAVCLGIGFLIGSLARRDRYF